MKKFTAALLVLAFCIGFMACNSELIITEDTIKGVWVTEAESQNLYRYQEYSFDGKGNGSYRIFQNGEASERIKFTYKLEDAVLTLMANDNSTVYNTTFDGTKLLLKRNAEEISLTKQR